MKNLLTGALAVGTLAIGCLGQVSSAEATTFGFQNITTGNSLAGDPYVSNFSVDVTSYSGGSITNGVLFKFSNNITSALNAFIGQIAIDDSNTPQLLSFASDLLNVNNTGTVAFSETTTGTFSQGGSLTPKFVFDYAADRNPGGGANLYGIQKGESLGVAFALNGTSTLQNVIDAINDGSLRLGIHVQSLPTVGYKTSDSFITKTTPVPTPALLPGAIGMGIAALRRKKREQGLEEATQEA